MLNLIDHAASLNGQTVIVRCNFDVPISNGQVTDTTRLEDAVPTIKLLRQANAKCLLLAHAGRPDGNYLPEDSLKPVTPILSTLVGEPVSFTPYTADYHQLPLSGSPIELVDNLRYWQEESANEVGFAQFWASHASAYVNEAFANCHRSHASMVGIPQILTGSRFAGLALAKEIAILEKTLRQPEHPFVVIIGGAKLETKAPLVKTLSPLADTILVGGKIAADLAFKPHPPNVILADLLPDAKDITPASARTFADRIMSARTVIWNGTMGIFEEPEHQAGTRVVAQAVNQTAAFTLVGGGDTEAALTVLKLESGIDHISSGGGAMLSYLSQGHLVALDAL